MPTPPSILPADVGLIGLPRLELDHDFLASAEKLHAQSGFDFATAFDHFFSHGWMFKGPGYFLLGGHDPHREDAWLVWWAELHPKQDRVKMLKLLLRFIPYHKPYIGWARALKGRIDVKYYSTSRLFRFIQPSIAKHAPTQQ